MTRTFVMTPEFDKCWKNIGLTDQELKELQEEILLNPQVGAVIQGTGGLRKIRYAIGNKGKSGSIRVLYVDLVIHEKVYLITAYTKNQKDNLSNEEKAIIKKMIEQLKDEANRGGKK